MTERKLPHNHLSTDDWVLCLLTLASSHWSKYTVLSHLLPGAAVQYEGKGLKEMELDHFIQKFWRIASSKFLLLMKCLSKCPFAKWKLVHSLGDCLRSDVVNPAKPVLLKILNTLQTTRFMLKKHRNKEAIIHSHGPWADLGGRQRHFQKWQQRSPRRKTVPQTQGQWVPL